MQKKIYLNSFLAYAMANDPSLFRKSEPSKYTPSTPVDITLTSEDKAKVKQQANSHYRPKKKHKGVRR